MSKIFKDQEEEFRAICKEIVTAKMSIQDWRDTESCDEFQSRHFCGGFDACEDAFCFSIRLPEQGEKWSPAASYWFQISLEQAASFAAGGPWDFNLRVPD